MQLNDALHPCIQPQEYKRLEKECADNRKLLGLPDGNQRNTITTILNWPLKPAANLHDCSYYVIAAYVDENPAAGLAQDFNCGSNTYDGHRGTDISTWPYNFIKMDSNLVEVVAAAPGMIISKRDGEYDRNCVGPGSALNANYIMIQHADGSTALYWHMKSGSVNQKKIGESILAGEHLGIVGSSGSSGGPHLHFEIWAGGTIETRIDPYFGTCNTLNAASWWAAQKPYAETQLVKVSVNTTDIIIPACPAAEIPNEATVYTIPFQGYGLPPGYAKFYIFIREEISGLIGTMKILRPDGSTYLTWTYTSASSNKIRYWAWSKVLPTEPGTYTFTAAYNGNTCSSTFDIVAASTAVHEVKPTIQLSAYPNPSSGQFTLTLPTDHATITVTNSLGRQILKTTATEMTMQLQLELQDIYIIHVTTQEGSASQKLIVLR